MATELCQRNLEPQKGILHDIHNALCINCRQSVQTRNPSDTTKSSLTHLTTRVSCSFLDLSAASSTINLQQGVMSCEFLQGAFSAHDEPSIRASRSDSQEQCACRCSCLATGVPQACLRLSNEAAGLGKLMHRCHHLAGLVLAWPENEH